MGNEFQRDEKRDYLIKTFSRTKRKDYENYVLNAIWHKLDRSDIWPVTQQYIKLSDGRYALMDLYFPQLRIGIECDEAHHIGNEGNDQYRTIKMRENLSMEDVLSAYDEEEGFKLLRIKAYESIESVERQIDDVVAAVKDRIRRNIDFVPWNFDEAPYEKAISRRQIHVADRLSFRTAADVYRCFGRNYKNLQKTNKEIGHGYYVWCPKLAINIDGQHKSVSKGWVNVLSDDWETITTTSDDPNILRELDYRSITETLPRITFAKSTDILGRSAYRFIGVYVRDMNDIRASLGKVEVLRRKEQYINLAPWLDALDVKE